MHCGKQGERNLDINIPKKKRILYRRGFSDRFTWGTKLYQLYVSIYNQSLLRIYVMFVCYVVYNNIHPDSV